MVQYIRKAQKDVIQADQDERRGTVWDGKNATRKKFPITWTTNCSPGSRNTAGKQGDTKTGRYETRVIEMALEEFLRSRKNEMDSQTQ
jgi:hypothetical protein